jgi:hypothetical protein
MNQAPGCRLLGSEGQDSKLLAVEVLSLDIKGFPFKVMLAGKKEKLYATLSTGIKRELLMSASR